MKIKESIQRLGWRFRESIKKNKSFIPNQNDVDAMNSLIDFYEKATTANYENNELMFKMYLWHKIVMMKHYKEDIFGSISQKELTRYLLNPRSRFIDRFVKYLNNQEYNTLIEQVSDQDKPFYMKSRQERENEAKSLSELLKTNPELFKKLKGEVWDYKEVEGNLISEFNQFLQVCA